MSAQYERSVQDERKPQRGNDRFHVNLALEVRDKLFNTTLSLH